MQQTRFQGLIPFKRDQRLILEQTCCLSRVSCSSWSSSDFFKCCRRASDSSVWSLSDSSRLSWSCSCWLFSVSSFSWRFSVPFSSLDSSSAAPSRVRSALQRLISLSRPFNLSSNDAKLLRLWKSWEKKISSTPSVPRCIRLLTHHRETSADCTSDSDTHYVGFDLK